MCDYSLHHVRSRPAKVGDKLTTHNFNTCAFSKPSPPEKSSDSRRICVRNHQDSAADEVLSRRSSPFKLSDMRQRYGAGSALAAETHGKQDQGDERRGAGEGGSRAST